nr:immunoglobulin light chain junction region [Macaca mulatta]
DYYCSSFRTGSTFVLF